MTRRHRYIRFFISSTFADMTRERNLLQEIFHDLNARYEPHHWQIEYVDLRWGITSEAGSDNRTMRICLEELERCRSLSPRPNFIILTGERYGWRPLPEVLSRQESECIRRGATAEELRLFERWYRSDTNQLPEPVLLLQPRTDEYLNDTNWDLKVYRPLRALFERLQGPLPSATELEIRHGALQVEDAREHVVAYFRHLHDIPAERLTTYEEPEATPVRRLETLLRSRLAAENILTEEIPFAEYETTEFGQRFRREMTARLTRIIDRVVAQTPEEPTEEEIHLDRIETDHPFLVGREEELSALERYLHDPQANHALWLRSCPGAGKTALLAALVRRCRDTHRVILRLCAETDRTRNGSRLLNSIWTRMSELFPPEQWVCRNLPGYGPAGTRSPLSASEMFRTRLRQIRSSSRPLLILVDGMEQLSDEGSDEFFSLAWADGELSPDVRIILTSSDDPRLNPEPRRIEIRTLETLPEADALGMVEECLRRSHRTLSDAQHRRMEQAVAASDRRPVYLSLLADLLQRLHSYEEPAVFPADFETLVRTALDQLVTTHDHDRELIRLAFSLFAADRQVYDLQRLLKTFRVSSSWNRGINTLASDNAGACIAVSMGVNALQEYAPELLLAEEGSTLRKLIPRRDTRFFSTCDVSPTGDRIWLSEAEASGSLLLLDRRGGLIAERPESGSRISIRHTDDGRFVAACVGDRISDPAPQIDLLTRDGDLLRRFTPKAPRSELLFKGPVTLSPDNRYLVSCDGDIVDLVDERLVYLNDRWDDLARCVDPSPLLPALRFAIHPFGHLLLGERRIVDLATGTVTETAFGGRAIGCTRSGRYLFLLDGERNLLVSGLYPGTAEPRILARAVNEVFPTDNERYLFARQLDGTLLFIDLRENRILQRAFLAEGRLFRTTRRGLAAVSGDGRLCLFEPAAEFGLQRETTVTIARRWDLATGRQSSTPEAVCPACGQVFTPPSQLLDRIRRHPASQAPDWEREKLLTVCPTCHATLRCNPHIVE